ncbi:MAG: sigma-70 family RNA polymerase sigma factor [Phycisphaerae bacterium]|nr:MAG: sigma-70 family RNA polymerase sigma factor [Planctomycetota bacterium]MBE7457353.1 sigma-70 family RNA polymerase sigma factor [Planctomycetia bacterium]MCL4720116.1 sigma-70 family RNA polymerase sigma factor [Phycisphaerae bacterium]
MAERPSIFRFLTPTLYQRLRKRFRKRAGQCPGASPTDLLHDCLVRAARSKRRADNRDHFLARMMLYFRGALLNRFRRAKIEPRTNVDLPSERLEIPAWPLCESAREMLGSLAVVNATQAACIRMRYLEGMSAYEIGIAMMLAERTVQVHIASGLAWLREQFPGEEMVA